MAFSYHQTVPVVFGNGAISVLGEKVAELGCKKVLCVYDSGVLAAGIAPKAEASLAAAGVEYVVFDQVKSDPADELVNECGALARKEKVDGVVAVGGGSSMDCAKAAALLVTHEPPIQQYFTAPPCFVHCDIPIIHVPTTAGTGSEVTEVAVITKSDDHSKPAIFLNSAMAIVDPELTLTVPKSVTAYTGLDALTHAMEAITSRNRNPHSEVLALAAIRKIAEFLPQAYDDGSNLTARYEMCLAANWAGIAFTDTDCHLGHAMADGISSKFHTPHGVNCILSDAEIIGACAAVVPDKVQLIGEALGASFPENADAETIGSITSAAIRALMRRVEIKSAKEMGFDRDEFIDRYHIVMEIDLGLRMDCPLEVTPELVKSLYERIYDNY